MSDAPVAEFSTAGSAVRCQGRTPLQAFNFARYTAILLTGIVPLLTIPLYFLAPPSATPAPLSTVWIAILAVVAVYSLLSPVVAGALAKNAAKAWARSGKGLEQSSRPYPASKALGLDVGSASFATRSTTLWDRFSTLAITGSALPELILLVGFAATFVSHDWRVMTGCIAVYAAGWILNFPRRSQWDAWASSAGLELPWD